MCSEKNMVVNHEIVLKTLHEVEELLKDFFHPPIDESSKDDY